VSYGLSLLNVKMISKGSNSCVLEIHQWYPSEFFLELGLMVDNAIEFKKSFKKLNKRIFCVEETFKKNEIQIQKHDFIELEDLKDLETVAKELSSKIESSQSEKLYFLLKLCKIHFKLNRTNEFKAILSTVGKHDPKDILNSYFQGKLYLSQDKMDEAKACLFHCLYFDDKKRQDMWIQELRNLLGEDFELDYAMYCTQY
jgi:predicted Zn-dependent protease